MTPDTPEEAEKTAPPPPPPPPPPEGQAPTAEGAPAEGAAPAEAPKAEEPKKPEVEFPEDAKKGRVRAWNPGNKQGEIHPDDGSTAVKFHVKQIANPSPEPKEGDKVAFKAPEATKTAKGKILNPTATEVWVIERTAPRQQYKEQLEYAGKVRGRPDWESEQSGDRGHGRGRGRGGPGGGRGGPGGGRGGPGGGRGGSGGGRGGPGGGRGGPG